MARGFGTLDSRPWTLDFAICPCLPHKPDQEDTPLSQESENSYRLTAGCGGSSMLRCWKVSKVRTDTRLDEPLRSPPGARKSALPAITKLLGDPDENVRMTATNVLKEIDQDTATKAGVK